MNLGTQNKKSVYALSVLGVVALYMVYSQFFAGPTYKPVSVPVARPEVPGDVATVPTPAPERSSGPDISQAKSKVGRPTTKSKAKNGEFHPAVIPKKVEDRARIDDIDPTIRFDLLARALKVPPAGGLRDLFQISKTPPTIAKLGPVEPTIKPFIPVGPRVPPPPPPPPQPKVEPPTPIPFKFYGVSAIHPDGTRTAYFIMPGADGDEILKANEGEVLKGRFKIVSIALDKVLVEDTHDKRRQPLNMEKEATQ